MRFGVIPEGLKERAALFTDIAPLPLAETFMGMAMARAIGAAVRLGIFDSLAEGVKSSAELAGGLDIDEDGTDALMMSLWSLGYVEPKDGSYKLTGLAKRFLVADSPDSVATYAGHLSTDMWSWLEKTEGVIRGDDPVDIHAAEAGDPFWERYMRALFEVARFGADEIAIRLSLPRCDTRMLDLAGGHGAYSCAMVRRYPRLKSTVFELEGAAQIGARLVSEAGLSDRIDYRVGDMTVDDLGRDYDLVCIFQILHHLSPDECLSLLDRARASLREGGKVAVLEQVMSPEGERPTQLGALAGLMFFVTSGARTYSAAEITGWLGEARYEQVREHRLTRFPGMSLVTARA